MSGVDGKIYVVLQTHTTRKITIIQLNQKDVNLGESQSTPLDANWLILLLQVHTEAQPGAFPRGCRLSGDHMEF